MYNIILTGCILLIAFLNLYTFPDVTDITTIVSFASLNFVVFVLYYCIYLLVSMCLPRRFQMHSRNNGSSDYSDLHHSEHEISYGRPRLYITDVWILVYGVGFTFFIMNYVMTCRDLFSTQSFVYALTIMVLSEVLENLWTFTSLLYLAISFLAFTGIM
jgi:hypothetical protein